MKKKKKKKRAAALSFLLGVAVGLPLDAADSEIIPVRVSELSWVDTVVVKQNR